MPALTAKYPTTVNTTSVKIMPARKLMIDFIALHVGPQQVIGSDQPKGMTNDRRQIPRISVIGRLVVTLLVTKFAPESLHLNRWQPVKFRAYFTFSRGAWFIYGTFSRKKSQ
jgi:hypothetical protein